MRRAAAIPDASHVPFTCPSPSHDAPHPFSMCHRHPRRVPASTSTGHPRPAPVPCPCHRALTDTIRMPPPPMVRTSTPTCCPPMLTRCPRRPPTLYVPPPPPSTSHTRRGPLRCVPTHFDAPRPFSTCRRHPRCVPVSTSTGHPRLALPVPPRTHGHHPHAAPPPWYVPQPQRAARPC